MHTLLRKVFILCVIFAIAACVDTPNTRQTAAQESQNFPLRGPAGVRSKAAAPKQLPTGRVALVIGNSAYTVSGLELINLEQLENGTIDDIMNSGFPLRGPAGVRAKTATVAARLGETNAPIQEFKFTGNLVYTLSINHE